MASLAPSSAPYAFLQKACNIASKGVLEDRNQNYDEALRLYEESEAYFYYAIKYEAKTDDIKETIRNKCKEYQDRVRELQSRPHRRQQ